MTEVQFWKEGTLTEAGKHSFQVHGGVRTSLCVVVFNIVFGW